MYCEDVINLENPKKKHHWRRKARRGKRDALVASLVRRAPTRMDEEWPTASSDFAAGEAGK